MMIVSALNLLSEPDAQHWLLGALMTIRLATAGINFAVAIHTAVRDLRKKAK